MLIANNCDETEQIEYACESETLIVVEFDYNEFSVLACVLLKPQITRPIWEAMSSSMLFFLTQVL